MPFYKWDESLATGVVDIDVHHQLIFVIINNFIEEYLRGRGKDTIRPVIDFLSDYVVKHFSLEEKYMSDYSYPEYSFHKSQHTQFRQDFDRLTSRFENEGVTSGFVDALKQRVGDWLKNHIMEVDKALAGFLKAKCICK
ncbi:MAG: hemerythrin family protein [Nitrospinae bacterium]|nr:hemerythrin family protein [Nitrospinota bacterium]